MDTPKILRITQDQSGGQVERPGGGHRPEGDGGRCVHAAAGAEGRQGRLRRDGGDARPRRRDGASEESDWSSRVDFSQHCELRPAGLLWKIRVGLPREGLMRPTLML